jgi:methyl-accepting chemotaxis protein
MELIFYWPPMLPVKFSVIIKIMNKLHENINHLMLALIIGVASLGVSFIGDMSKNISNMAASIEQLNTKMGQVSETMRDHEFRLRDLEKKKGEK